MLAALEDEVVGTMSFASLTDAIAVGMEEWSTEHRAFIVETFKTQRIFRNHFNSTGHGKVPCYNTIQSWVENFGTNAFALKKKPPGSVPTVQLPQNLEAVRQSFLMSPRCSARRHFVAVGISNCSVRRILKKDLNFHANKMVVVQELRDCDMANSSTIAERLIRILSDNVIILMTDEAHFHLPGCVSK
jgi:hypothetical protein